jgi:hypothetical protein
MNEPKLWSDGWDYNEVTKDRPSSWKLYSRINDYRFFLENGKERRLIDIINEFDIKSILDYGCGNSTSIRRILQSSNKTNVKLYDYDPFVKGKDIRPNEMFDMVVCHNVLGGIEENYVPAVIEDLINYSKKIVIIKIPTGKERVEGFVKQIHSIKHIDVLESSILSANEYSAKITLSQLFVYFLLRKHEQTDEEYKSR